MIREILRQIEPSISSAIALLALTPQMTADEQGLIDDLIIRVVQDTAIVDLKEKDALNYMKLYLKTRKETQTPLEDLINEDQQRRLQQLSE